MNPMCCPLVARALRQNLPYKGNICQGSPPMACRHAISFFEANKGPERSGTEGNSSSGPTQTVHFFSSPLPFTSSPLALLLCVSLTTGAVKKERTGCCRKYRLGRKRRTSSSRPARPRNPKLPAGNNEKRRGFSSDFLSVFARDELHGFDNVGRGRHRDDERAAPAHSAPFSGRRCGARSRSGFGAAATPGRCPRHRVDNHIIFDVFDLSSTTPTRRALDAPGAPLLLRPDNRWRSGPPSLQSSPTSPTLPKVPSDPDRRKATSDKQIP